MRVVIVGCGRVGAVVAGSLDGAGHEVVVIDTSTSAFDRLPASFRGVAVRADGTDEDSLRRAGAENADVFLAMTEGDNRNVMAAQLAIEALGVKRVVAKVNDPVRAEAYADLGIATICRTDLMAHALLGFIGQRTAEPPAVRAAGIHAHQSVRESAESGPGGSTAAAAGLLPSREV
jgi:trk system potassium uptake protein TrkA